MKKLTALAALSSPSPSPSDSGQPGGISNPVLISGGNDIGAAESGSLLFQILGGVLQFMMVLAVILVLINLVQGAISWIGSGGESGKLKEARDRITNAVVGLVVLAATYAIWMLVRQFLGVDVSFEPLFN